eukprot:81176-Amphidinium_carterae.1
MATATGFLSSVISLLSSKSHGPLSSMSSGEWWTSYIGASLDTFILALAWRPTSSSGSSPTSSVCTSCGTPTSASVYAVRWDLTFLITGFNLCSLLFSLR